MEAAGEAHGAYQERQKTDRVGQDVMRGAGRYCGPDTISRPNGPSGRTFGVGPCRKDKN